MRPILKIPQRGEDVPLPKFIPSLQNLNGAVRRATRFRQSVGMPIGHPLILRINRRADGQWPSLQAKSNIFIYKPNRAAISEIPHSALRIPVGRPYKRKTNQNILKYMRYIKCPVMPMFLIKVNIYKFCKFYIKNMG
ncbi:MAG: hypothetical protein IJ766_03460 [Clostridia bacterium]|nr:hypothetical protein [Clostridia bacterium]